MRYKRANLRYCCLHECCFYNVASWERAKSSTIRTCVVRAECEEWPLRGIIDCRAGAAGSSVGEKKGNLVMEQLHLLHMSEHLNERAILSMYPFYLSRIKTHVPCQRNERRTRFFMFYKEKRDRGKCFCTSKAKGRRSIGIDYLQKRSFLWLLISRRTFSNLINNSVNK